MGTIVEFRLLVLDSLKYSSKAESHINRSAKAVISRNLTTSRRNHLLIYFAFLFLFFIFYFYFYFLLFIFFIYFLFLFLCFIFYFYFFPHIYRKQTLPSYLHSDSNRCYCLTRMNKKYLLVTYSNSCLL